MVRWGLSYTCIVHQLRADDYSTYCRAAWVGHGQAWLLLNLSDSFPDRIFKCHGYVSPHFFKLLPYFKAGDL